MVLHSDVAKTTGTCTSVVLAFKHIIASVTLWIGKATVTLIVIALKSAKNRPKIRRESAEKQLLASNDARAFATRSLLPGLLRPWGTAARRRITSYTFNR